jgi:hypothetical protein
MKPIYKYGTTLGSFLVNNRINFDSLKPAYLHKRIYKAIFDRIFPDEPRRSAPL